MIQHIGRWVFGRIKSFGYAAGFFWLVMKEALLFFRKKQVGFKVFVLQVFFTGYEALTVIALLSMSIGAVIIIQGLNLLPQFGQGQLIYTILITVITRELGPILTAFIIIARSGTAIATELGNMVVNHEIEAYQAVGINPISYLVVPRFLGVTVSILLLNIYFNVFGLGGSFLLTRLIRPIQFQEYFSNLLQQIGMADIVSSLVKSLVFGVIISIVATYHGFNVQQASYEVPVAAIKAVGQGFVMCILADAVITMIYYL
ncbi:MAG: ABC transporter permease [Spirochaetales bacterium]|nr:ABC transporter permease [Spirochaetales bacterium]